MIFVIDDEKIFLALTREALRQEGFEVETFEGAADALERLETAQPELIISDIVMPEMDGFEFRKEYSRRFPNRTTPFVFLSSLGDPEQLVRGLDSEVDDYLVKPIDPRVMQAKVRSLLKRRETYPGEAFQGDLALFPFIKVVQFCEQQGLTGEVSFDDGELKAVVPFKAGALVPEAFGDSDDELERLYDLKKGRFTIKPGIVDFSALGGAAIAQEKGPQAPPSQATMPMGRLSGIKIGDRLFQVQTEMVLYPEKRVVTVVILEGNTVLKRSQPVEAPAARAELEALIIMQHKDVKAEVHQKIEDLDRAKGIEAGAKTETDQYYELFDAGLEAYRQGDVEKALEFWLEARDIRPDDPTLEINLKIGRSKLQNT